MLAIENIRTFVGNIGLFKKRDFCRDMVCQVMNYCKESDDEDAIEFKEFRKKIRVAGFRPGKVSDSRFVEEISKFKDMKDWLLELLLNLWYKQHNENMEDDNDVASSVDNDQQKNFMKYYASQKN